MRVALASTLAFLAFAVGTTAEEGCTDDAMIVFDGSGSMAEMGFNDIDEPRIFDARRAIADVLPGISAKRRLGLVTYGPGGVDSCTGVDLKFPPIANSAPRILSEVNTLEPAGDTPLTDAVRRAAEVLKSQSDGGTVVLVTDGKETCGGKPCELGTELSYDDITVHIIGFKVRGSFFAWGSTGANDYSDSEPASRCLADQTGGLYARAETLEELKAALRVTLGCNILM